MILKREMEEYRNQAQNCLSKGALVEMSPSGLLRMLDILEAAQQSAQVDLPCTCPKSPLGFVMVKAHDCPEHGTAIR